MLLSTVIFGSVFAAFAAVCGLYCAALPWLSSGGQMKLLQAGANLGFLRGVMAIPYLACMIATAQFYALPPRVLPSIAVVEGGRPGLVHQNTNRTADLGLMQVNTQWIRPISGVTKQSPAITAQRLINEPCFSIAAAGAIMHVYLRESNGDLLRAVGFYHSHTPALGAAYRTQVLSAAVSLFDTPRG
jgi:hypothetical protein